jgi:hypothetical protein
MIANALMSAERQSGQKCAPLNALYMHCAQCAPLALRNVQLSAESSDQTF